MRIKGFFGFIILLFLFLGLVGCNSFSSAELMKAKAGYITDISDKRILVNDTYFSAAKNVEVVSDSGKQMEFNDLQIGVKVEPWFDGGIRESFPAQADVKKIVIMTDKKGTRIQEAVKAIVVHAEAKYGKPIVFQESLIHEEYFQTTIAGVNLENPNPVTIRYNFTTKQVQVE